MVDFSEDVSSKDLVSAAAEGYDSIELVKRYTTATMGPAQGKLETVNPVAVLAEANGTTIEDTGTTVWRPPVRPDHARRARRSGYEPVRYSPMQPWHEAHGARPLVAGDWIRPDHYGDPAAEVRNVRSNVGIIDVTPLGKLDLRGPDVPKLLNLLYVNQWNKLDDRRRPLRRDVRRGRCRPRRRRDRSAGTRALRDVDDVVRCGDGVGVGPELVADGTSRVARPRHARSRRRTRR